MSSEKKKKAVDDYKIFNDSVHGHIKMDSVLMEIIDTPEFQRLRNIKQLGGGYYVFPGASHNRFEHSIGVAHLAGLLVQSLMKKQTKLGITYKDKLCVQIAALCHDLGHGPFSHLFEDFMKKKSKPTGKAKIEAKNTWTHEKQSIKMFECLWLNKRVTLQEKISEICEKKFKNKDLLFIKELIYGPEPPTFLSLEESESEPAEDSEEESKEDSKWPYKGRPKEKSFLYEILANKTTGIDVDKMDYFSRDCLHLGMNHNFSHERFVMFARVCENEKGINQICMRDKEALNMYEIFHVRYLLYNNVCHHRVTEAIQTMIVDTLLAADNHLKISEAVKTENLKDYLRLTDNILQDIMRSSESGLKHAKEIIERIETRDLYKCVGEKKFKTADLKHLKTDDEWQAKVVNNWLQGLPKELQSSSKYIKVKKVKLNYGGDEDPIKSLRFYRKNDEDKAVQLEKDEISYLLPENFAEFKVMMFYTGPNTSEEQKQIPTKLKAFLNEFWDKVREPQPTQSASPAKKPKTS